MQREDLARFDLPDTPGVYFFMRSGDILYIGKATSLQDRVRSYFSKDLAATRSPAIAAMVERSDEIRFLKADSVLEALIQEANLIKKHQPPYNTDERDNKSFNYLVVTKEPYPRFKTIRGRELFDPTVKKDFVVKHLFGPYPQGGALKEALKIVRKIFPYRDTCEPESGKPCFNAQIGLCPGVCSGACSRLEYAHNVRNITDLFKGNFHGLKQRLIREMREAADSEHFEEAGVLRRQVTALEHIRDVSLIKDESRIAPGGSVRIEGYDVAHTAGKETVGVMTVVDGGEAMKSEYRKFTIKTAGNDDPASLQEMLERRLAHPWCVFLARCKRGHIVCRKGDVITRSRAQLLCF
jgi:excinuclease ABC subunit C